MVASVSAGPAPDVEELAPTELAPTDPAPDAENLAATSVETKVLEELSEERRPLEEVEFTETLINNVQSRLEELLSKQSLADDAFIQQHFNAQMYIPLSVLIRHTSMQSLGASATTLLEAAKAAAQQSEKVTLDKDGWMVRPILKPRRNTLILHDLPEEVTEEELVELFASSPESESFCSVKPDVNNTAFAAFKNDESAQNAALWLRSQKLKGSVIKCAIKSEHFVRSFFPASPSPMMQAANPYMMPGQVMMWNPQWMQVQQWQGQTDSDALGYDMSHMWSDGRGWQQFTGPQGTGESGADGHFVHRDSKGDLKGKGKGKGKGKRKGKGDGGSFSSPDMDMMQMEALPRVDKGSAPMPRMSNENFPPLAGNMPWEPDVSAAAAATGVSAEDDFEIGYKHNFRQYSRQQIIEVCNNMEEITKPESYQRLESENAVALFRETACKDWAPLPTPQLPFASSFSEPASRHTESGRERADSGASGYGGSKASWGRGSRSQSVDRYEDSEWAKGDTKWWEPKAPRSKSRRRSSSRSYRKGWDDYSDKGYGQQWVEKGSAEQDSDSKDQQASRKPSWAEKVRGGGHEGWQSHPRWVAKTAKTEAEKAEDDGAAVATSTEAAMSEPGPAPPISAPAGAAKAAEVPGDGVIEPKASVNDSQEASKTGETAAPSAPTWADKVRQGTNQK